MDETHDSRLAAILARGLIRVRQRAERAGAEMARGDDESQPTAAELPGDDHRSPDAPAAGSEQGEQR